VVAQLRISVYPNQLVSTYQSKKWLVKKKMGSHVAGSLHPSEAIFDPFPSLIGIPESCGL
jgi:hypothetical protein